MTQRNFSRRDALRLAGAASAAVAAGSLAQGQTATPAPADGPLAPSVPNGAGFYRFKVGDLTLTLLSDGQSAPGPTFPNWGANPDRQPVYAAALRENFLNPDAFVNNFNPLLIESGNQKILMDTGRGGQAGDLRVSLARAGVRPEQVTTVFLSHGHGDHIGGVTTAGQPTYPNAQLVMGQTEFQFWTTQANPNDAVKNNLIALRDRFKLVKAGDSIASGVSALDTAGHTPGHLALRVSSGADTFTHFGDAGGHYILSFQFPEHFLGFDADKPAAVAMRARLFAEAADGRHMVAGYHFAWPALGYVRRVGNAYQFVPAFFRLT